MIPEHDYGGDCMYCMAACNDPDAIDALIREAKKMSVNGMKMERMLNLLHRCEAYLEMDCYQDLYSHEKLDVEDIKAIVEEIKNL